MPTTTGQTTLLAVRTAARQRSDMVNSTFLTDAEFNANIQSSQQELYGLLVQAYGNDYFMAGTPDLYYQFTTTTSSSYVLPDGSTSYKLSDNSTTAPAFFKLLGVDLYTGAAVPPWVTLKPFMFGERNRGSTSGVLARSSNLCYRIAGDRLWLAPQPQSGLVLRLFYVPRLTLPTADSDVIDGVNGWEEFIVIDAAIKALQKEESDCSVLLMQKQAIVHRLESESQNRDAGSPARVVETRRDVGGYGYAGLWQGDL